MEVLWKDPASEAKIRSLMLKLPNIVPDSDVSVGMDEWKLLADDDTRPEWIDSGVAHVLANSVAVDVYWSHVLKRNNVLGFPKYPTLAKVVKAWLAMSHGNADAERSFSYNKNIVTSERSSMIAETVCAVRMVKDGIKQLGGSGNVTIHSDLLQLTRSSYAQYKKHLDDVKKAEEIDKHQKLLSARKKKEEEIAKKKEAAATAKRLKMQKLDACESEINSEQEKMHAVLKTSALLLKEAEAKLSAAIAVKDIDQISVAQAMLQAANQKMSSANSSIQDTHAKRKDLIARKRKLQKSINESVEEHGASSSKKSK